MRERLIVHFLNSFISYKALEGLLEESGKITDRDIQTLKNLSKDFFNSINNIIHMFPEEGTEQNNEEIKENISNETKTN